MVITFEELYSYLNYEYDIYSDEQRFLNDFYGIGFIKRSNEVLDLNLKKYPQIDFTYDNLTRIESDKFNSNFKQFLKSNVQFDDVLFYIAENYFETFMSFKSEHITQFEIIKKTYIKRPNFEEFVKKIGIKIDYFQDLLDRVRFSVESDKLNVRDLSSSLKAIKFDKDNYELFNDITKQITDFENMNQKYFDRDKLETIRYFEIAIRTLENIRNQLTFNETRYDRYMDNKNYIQNINFEMSSPMMKSSNSEQFDELNEVNLVENFNELSNKIFDEIGTRINSDIYINFPALSRLCEHYDDINELKNKVGNILKT